MSEEIIEIIEELQCEYKEQQNDKKYNDYTVHKAKRYSNGLQGLLDLYNKEKETSHFIQSQLDEANAKLIEEKEKNKELKKVIHNIQNEKFPTAFIFEELNNKWEVNNGSNNSK